MKSEERIVKKTCPKYHVILLRLIDHKLGADLYVGNRYLPLCFGFYKCSRDDECSNHQQESCWVEPARLNWVWYHLDHSDSVIKFITFN